MTYLVILFCLTQNCLKQYFLLINWSIIQWIVSAQFSTFYRLNQFKKQYNKTQKSHMLTLQFKVSTLYLNIIVGAMIGLMFCFVFQNTYSTSEEYMTLKWSSQT